MRSGRTFLPHQDARMTSGRAAITAPGATIRSFAALARRRLAKTSSPLEISINSETQPIDRKSGVSGKRVSVSVDLGGHRIIKKKNKLSTVVKGKQDTNLLLY